jgi:anti-sigma factor RsiW
MRCHDCRELLSSLLDLELSPDEASTVREHLAQCPDCSRRYAALEATSALLQRDLVRHIAPDVLKARIRRALAEPDRHLAPPESPRRWLRLAAAGLVIAVASSVATYGTVRERATVRAVRNDILASHLRSLMPGHLTDVTSNDQHNVKPWFNGRVDQSPSVPKLDTAGFVLDGGRLDYVAGRAVAVLAYSRRQHVVNLFSWPDAGSDEETSFVTMQGYHLIGWRSNNVAYWAASDLNPRELGEFVSRFRAASTDDRR